MGLGFGFNVRVRVREAGVGGAVHFLLSKSKEDLGWVFFCVGRAHAAKIAVDYPSGSLMHFERAARSRT